MKKSRLPAVIATIVFLLAVAVVPVWADEGDGDDASAVEENEGESSSVEDIIDHSSFETVLKKYVDDQGMVDYAGLKGSDDDLETFKEYIQDIATASLSEAGEEATKAFLINAYNALVIYDVVQRWPVENVLEEDDFFKERRHRLAGVKISLDGIEKQSLHARFDDPRTHFAVVCAARSCPRLRTTAFTAENVEEKLESIAREYIPRVTSVKGEGKVETSQLFEWYEDNFTRDAESVAEFLSSYVDDGSLRRVLEDGDVELEFSEYDWEINAQ